MSNNGLLDFFKENNINELCDLPFLDTCQYHDDEEYIRKGCNTENYVNIFSMNIRSLPKHGGEITVFLNTLQSDFKVIVLCEIGARNISTVENLFPGYDLYCVLPQNNMFGGVGIYLHRDLEHVKIIDGLYVDKTCHCSKCKIESIFVSFTYLRREYVVGGIYRHPKGNVNHFTNDLF